MHKKKSISTIAKLALLISAASIMATTSALSVAAATSDHTLTTSVSINNKVTKLVVAPDEDGLFPTEPLSDDEKITFAAKTNPQDVEIKWFSTDSDVAVFENGNVFVPKGYGSTVVVASSQDGTAKFSTQTIIVTPGTSIATSLNITGVTYEDGGVITTGDHRDDGCEVKSYSPNRSIIQYSDTMIPVADGVTFNASALVLTATAKAGNATAANQSFIWTSSNPAVAAVSDFTDGPDTIENKIVVTPKGYGKATITATTTDSSMKKATFTVEYKTAVNVAAVKLSDGAFTVYNNNQIIDVLLDKPAEYESNQTDDENGSFFTIYAATYDKTNALAMNQNVTWTSSDTRNLEIVSTDTETIDTVVYNRITVHVPVTAIPGKTITLTAKSVDGAKTASLRFATKFSTDLKINETLLVSDGEKEIALTSGTDTSWITDNASSAISWTSSNTRIARTSLVNGKWNIVPVATGNTTLIGTFRTDPADAKTQFKVTFKVYVTDEVVTPTITYAAETDTYECFVKDTLPSTAKFAPTVVGKLVNGKEARTLTYQWYTGATDDVEDIEDLTAILNATKKDFTITSAMVAPNGIFGTAQDYYLYLVVNNVTDSTTKISVAATLTVKPITATSENNEFTVSVTLDGDTFRTRPAAAAIKSALTYEDNNIATAFNGNVTAVTLSTNKKVLSFTVDGVNAYRALTITIPTAWTTKGLSNTATTLPVTTFNLANLTAAYDAATNVLTISSSTLTATGFDVDTTKISLGGVALDVANGGYVFANGSIAITLTNADAVEAALAANGTVTDGIVLEAGAFTNTANATSAAVTKNLTTSNITFTLETVTAAYNAETGVLVLNSASFTETGVTADVTKIELGTVAIECANPVFAAGTATFTLTNKDAVNANITANGSISELLVLDADAFTKTTPNTKSEAIIAAIDVTVSNVTFTLETVTAAYDATTGVLLLTSASFTEAGLTADDAKIKLGDVAIDCANPVFENGSVTFTLSNKTAVNEALTITANGSETGFLVIEAEAFTKTTQNTKSIAVAATDVTVSGIVAANANANVTNFTAGDETTTATATVAFTNFISPTFDETWVFTFDGELIDVTIAAGSSLSDVLTAITTTWPNLKWNCAVAGDNIDFTEASPSNLIDEPSVTFAKKVL